MIFRLVLDWLLGRREPELDWTEKDKRLRLLNTQLEVMRRGRR